MLKRSKPKARIPARSPMQRKPLVLNGRQLHESPALRQSATDPKGMIASARIWMGGRLSSLRVELHFPTLPHFTCSAEEIQLHAFNSEGKPVRLSHSDYRGLQEQMTRLVLKHLE